MTSTRRPDTARKEPSLSREEQLAIAVEALSEHVVLFDAQDRVVLANKAWRELNKGIAEFTKPGTLFEDHLRALTEKGLLPEAIGREEAWLRERMKQHLNPGDPFEVARQDGRWMRMREQRLPNNGTILLIRDITESKQAHAALRRSEALLRQIIDNAPAMINLRDVEGRYLMVNEAFAQVRGLTPEAMVATTVHEGSTKHHAEEASGHHKKVVESGRTIIEERDTTLPGGARHLSLVLKFPIFDNGGNVAQVGSIGTDISELKEAEEQLVLAREAAVIANRAKSEFLANMSHELRTPLNAMIGFSEALQTGIYGPVSEQQKERIGDIHRSANYLLDLINDILDLSKVEAGKIDLDFDEVEVERTIESSLQLIAGRAKDAEIRISMVLPPGLPNLYANERILKQMLTNLLSNAVKFTPPGGEVVVSVLRPDDGGMCIEVRDTGIGIRKSDIPTAMAHFGQIANALTRKRKGTGLGLPLVKKFMELHRGALEIESEPGVGTVARLLFPAKMEQPISADVSKGPLSGLG